MCLSSLVYPQNAKLNNQTYKFYNQIIGELILESKDSMIILREDINHFPSYKLKAEVRYLMDVLNESDSGYIAMQLEERLNFRIDSVKIKGIQIIPKKFTDRYFKSVHYWDLIRAEYGSGYYSFGKPIFSKSMKRLYFMMGYCCGPECGHGQASMYEKKGGKWVQVKVCSSWAE